MSQTVIKLNNIPHGFYENEMLKYFSQFGKVKRVCVIRSSKTRKSRGFGFVEFAKHEPAKAATEVMHNYLMFNHVLKCRLMDLDRLDKVLSKHCKKGKQRAQTTVEQYKRQHNAVSKRDHKYLVKHYKKILRTQKLLDKMDIKLNCKVINPPDLTCDTHSITSGSSNSGETFSATTSDASNVCTSDSEQSTI